MPDGLVDPGETVTLNIALQNIGGTNTSQQLLATLQASGGVNAPSGQQDFGRLTAGGPSISRNGDDDNLAWFVGIECRSGIVSNRVQPAALAESMHLDALCIFAPPAVSGRNLYDHLRHRRAISFYVFADCQRHATSSHCLSCICNVRCRKWSFRCGELRDAYGD